MNKKLILLITTGTLLAASAGAIIVGCAAKKPSDQKRQPVVLQAPVAVPTTAPASKDSKTVAVKTNGAPQNQQIKIAGQYANSKATILVESEDNENARISVIWKQDGDKQAMWSMSGKFIAATKSLAYDNCTKR